MFKLEDFLKKGFIKAVGNMPSYKIILNATGWYDKEVLTLEDLDEINKAIEEYENNLKVTEETTETVVEPVEETTTEEQEEVVEPVEETTEEEINPEG